MTAEEAEARIAELERDYAQQRKELYWQAVEAEHRAEKAEARIAELEREQDGWKSAAESQNRQWSAKCTQLTEVRAELESRIAELERELDAAQEHIHAGDECITGLHDAAVLLRERMQIACNSSALDRDARIWGAAIRMLDASFALPPRKGGARAGERCHCQWEAGDSPCPMHGDECAPRGHAPECERVTHPQSCHPCDCGAGEVES